jgi:GntR family transcriptional regulator
MPATGSPTSVSAGGASSTARGRPRAAAAPAFQAIAPEAAGMPLYRAVKRRLLQAIEAGALPPGGALPNERELAGAFGVSIGTLRQAVGELVAEHILVRRQGRGTYVARHNAERFLFQFFHIERQDGLREAPELELLGFERVRLDETDAEAFGLKPGEPMIVIENRLRLQGRPVAHDRLLLPAMLFKGLTEARFRARPATIYRLYQDEHGITVVRAHERTRAVAADRQVARILGVAPGTPMLQVHRTAFSFGDRPVEYRVSTVHTAQHEYVQTLSRPG